MEEEITEKQMNRLDYIRIALLIIITIGIFWFAYEFFSANQAVKDLILTNNPKTILELCTRYSGEDCVILKSSNFFPSS